MLFLLLACNQGSDDSGDLPTCDTTVDATWPANGATHTYWRTHLEFQLSEADPTAVVVAPFPGSTEVLDDGRRIVYTPDAPLQPDTAYEVGLDYCHGSPRIAFQTSAVGTPLDTPEALLGRTFVLDLNDGRFIQGEGVGEVLAGVYGRRLLIQVLEVAGAALRVRAGTSTDAGALAQDACFRTQDLDLDFEESPFLSFGVTDYQFGAYADSLTLREFWVEGTMAPDMKSIEGVAFELTVSIDEVLAILQEGGFDVDNLDHLCELAENLGVSCEQCPDTWSTPCITLSADRMTATEAGIEVSEVDWEEDPCPD